MKTLVTAGCSFTKDNYQQTWADYLADSIGYTLNNVAARGAGIEFVSKRIMYECLIHHTDLAVVMLPSIDRFDWYIDRQHPWHNSGLSIASWQDGKESNLVQLDGTLSQESGYILSGGEVRGHKQQWYKFYYNESRNHHQREWVLRTAFAMATARWNFPHTGSGRHLVVEYTSNRNVLLHYWHLQFFKQFLQSRFYSATRLFCAMPARLDLKINFQSETSTLPTYK